MQVIVGVTHPLCDARGVKMEDLLAERWCFVPRYTEPHNRLCSLFSEKGLEPPALAVSSTSIVLLKSLVAHSGFISWLTRPMYAAELQAGLVRELRVDGLDHERRFGVYHRRVGILPGPAQRFLDEIRTLA